MTPTIKPTINDPHCLDFTRMPAGMVDPVYDQIAGEGFAGRDAATFHRCHEECPKKACRQARACLASGAISGGDACASPLWTASVQLLAVFLSVHAVNIRERHRAWDIARLLGADLPVCDPMPADEELQGDAPPVHRPRFVE